MTPASRARFDLGGKVALVTGGGRGLGRTLALGLAAHGADVAVASRTAAEVETVAAAIRATGHDALALPVDTTDGPSVDRMVGRVVERWGRLDVLVNNAGINVVAPTTDVPEADWRRVLDVDLTGYFLCARAAARAMIPRRNGSIVMNSSVGGSSGLARAAAYSAAKGGVNQLTRSLAVEWAAFGVRVNAVAPGHFDHVMTGNEHARDAAKEERVRTRVPLGRRGRADELIGPVVFLAADASSYVTGAILMVDGGLSAG